MSNENISELTTSCYKNFEEIENLRKVQEQIIIQEENKIEVEDKTLGDKGIIKKDSTKCHYRTRKSMLLKIGIIVLVNLQES